MDIKTAFASTKRRKYDTLVPTAPVSRVSHLSRRISRLSKKMKISNPLHVYYEAVSAFANFSTTGGVYDLCTGIAQVWSNVLCLREMPTISASEIPSPQSG